VRSLAHDLMAKKLWVLILYSYITNVIKTNSNYEIQIL